MATLETLTAEMLQPLVGAAFTVTLESGRVAEATLSRVEVMAAYPNAARTPFSFTLRVPGTRADAMQGTVRLAHAELGTLDLFAVPIGQDGDAILWQAVFS